MTRLPFSVPAWFRFSTSSALMNRRQLIDASRKAGANSISRVYQQKPSPTGGPPNFGFFMAVAGHGMLGVRHRGWRRSTVATGAALCGSDAAPPGVVALRYLAESRL